MRFDISIHNIKVGGNSDQDNFDPFNSSGSTRNLYRKQYQPRCGINRRHENVSETTMHAVKVLGEHKSQH